jgi:hypothetical protein
METPSEAFGYGFAAAIAFMIFVLVFGFGISWVRDQIREFRFKRAERARLDYEAERALMQAEIRQAVEAALSDDEDELSDEGSRPDAR